MKPEGIARPILSPHQQVVSPAHHEAGSLGTDIDGASITKVARWLEDGTTLTVVERNFLHIVERELPQVYLPVLCIAQFDAVIEDTQVIGTHTANVDSLDATHASIILELQAREITQGIGHRQGIQLLSSSPPNVCDGIVSLDINLEVTTTSWM